MKKFIVQMILCFFTVYASVYSQQWTVVSSPSPDPMRNILRGVGAISSNDVWAVGVSGQQPSFTLTQHWNGVNWTVINSPNHSVQYNELYAVKGLSSNDVYAVGYYSVIGTPQMLILHWDGTSWTEQTTPTVTGGSSLQSIVILGPDDIYAGGHQAVGAPGPTTGTLVTHWNGSSWNIESTPNQSNNRHNTITDMKGLSSNDIWAVGYSRKIGENYQAMVLHKTGSVWSIVPVPQSTSDENFLYSIDIIAEDDIWVSGDYNNGIQYGALFLHYNGSTWTTVYSPQGGSGIVHNTASDIWSTGSGFAHYDGSIWSSVSAPVPTEGSMGSMARVSSTDIWSVGRYIDGDAMKTLIMHYENSSLSLDLKALVQGFYDPLSDKMVKDTARIFLRNISSPYFVVDSARTVLDSNGQANITFSNASNSVPYYIVIKHRNGLETWSATGNSFTSGNLNYDFTLTSSQAYGNNQILKGSKYCIYSGDVNQDGIIDVTDLISVLNESNNLLTGYVPQDCNGDSMVDLSDLIITFNNSKSFVSIERP